MRIVAIVVLCGSLVASASAHAESWWDLHFGPTTVVGPSGQRVEGSGEAADETRTPGSFHAVRMQGPIDVTLRVGSTEQVVVHTDRNLLPMIETSVHDGVLEIGVARNAAFRTHLPLRVRVEFKSLDSIALRGSGDAHADRIRTHSFDAALAGSGDLAIDALDADIVAVSIAGSGDFRAAGTAATQGFSIAGSGDVKAADLKGNQVAVNITGSGDAAVNASESLQVSIAGSGDVAYHGSPRLAKSVVGSGEVHALR